ncbi:hypothetical protein ACFE04_023052 [Oxalis oulophora]
MEKAKRSALRHQASSEKFMPRHQERHLWHIPRLKSKLFSNRMSKFVRHLQDLVKPYKGAPRVVKKEEGIIFLSHQQIDKASKHLAFHTPYKVAPRMDPEEEKMACVAATFLSLRETL